MKKHGKGQAEQVAVLKELLEVMPGVSVSDAIAITGLSEATVKRVQGEVEALRQKVFREPQPSLAEQKRLLRYFRSHWARRLGSSA